MPAQAGKLFPRLRTRFCELETVLFKIYRDLQVEHSARTTSCSATTIALDYPNFLTI